MSKALRTKARALSEKTGLTVAAAEELCERYRQLDKSKNLDAGVPLSTMMTVPEFVGHPFIADLLRVYASGKVVHSKPDPAAGKKAAQPTTTTVAKAAHEEVEEEDLRITVDDYVMLAWRLSEKASDKVKQELAWRVIDIWQAGVLRQAEMFRVYRLLMSHALTDDQCLLFAQRALSLDRLAKKGEMTKEEFFDIVPAYEMRIKFTIDLQTKSSL